ncbi:MAG: gliding motility-associated protein GldE [Niabella sp.]
MNPDFLLSIHQHMILAQLSEGTLNTTLLVVGLLILIIFSFAISGTQAAIFSLEEKDVDVLKTKQQASAKQILELLREPKAVFVSMLISKTLVNICIIVLANYLINEYVPNEYLHSTLSIFLKFLLIALVLLFLVEIFPRVWASQNNLRFVYEWPFLIMIVQAFYFLFGRISGWLVSFGDSLSRGVGANKAEEKNMQQLDAAIDIQSDDEISPEGKNIMKGIVKFGKISVKTVMRSRLYVSGIDYALPMEKVVAAINEVQYSRLPVYKNNLDEIVGILNTKDLVEHLYENNSGFDWHSKIRAPYFIPESKLIEDLLTDFQQKRIHFAIVVDEFGGTSGIVTMEDIIEEVVGDIKDEFDNEENLANKVDEHTYVFEGRTMLHDICKAMGIPADTFEGIRGENESIGGLINELSGKLPKVGDVLESGDFEFTVLEAERNRVKSVKIVIKPTS